MSTPTELGMSATLLLCDSAAESGGKLYLQGAGWDMIQAMTYPWRVPRIGVGLSISVPWTQTNKNLTMMIHLEDEDGEKVVLARTAPDFSNPSSAGVKEVREIMGQLNVGRPPILVAGDAQSCPLAMNIDALELPGPGVYTFVVSMDSTELARARFRAMPAPGSFAFPT